MIRSLRIDRWPGSGESGLREVYSRQKMRKSAFTAAHAVCVCVCVCLAVIEDFQQEKDSLAYIPDWRRETGGRKAC